MGVPISPCPRKFAVLGVIQPGASIIVPLVLWLFCCFFFISDNLHFMLNNIKKFQVYKFYKWSSDFAKTCVQNLRSGLAIFMLFCCGTPGAVVLVSVHDVLWSHTVVWRMRYPCWVASDGRQLRGQSTAVRVTCMVTMTDCVSTATSSLMRTHALLSLVRNCLSLVVCLPTF